jgi:hypothetical protein
VIQLPDWPSEIRKGDSVLLRVRVSQVSGQSVLPYVPSAGIWWYLDSIRVAGLHGTGQDDQRWVVAFAPGRARIRVAVFEHGGLRTAETGNEILVR